MELRDAREAALEPLELAARLVRTPRPRRLPHPRELRSKGAPHVGEEGSQRALHRGRVHAALGPQPLQPAGTSSASTAPPENH